MVGREKTNRYQAGLKRSPFEALYGEKCGTPLFGNRPERNKCRRASEDCTGKSESCPSLGEKSYAYKRRRDLTFEVNDFVYPKLAPVYIGPFKVLEKKGVVAYKLELPPGLTGVHDVFHVSRLKKCLRVPEEETPPEGLDVQEDLTYTEHPRRFLIRRKRVTGTRGSKCASAVEASHEARGYLGKRRRDESGLP
ncbi:hypothetical protein U9M48_003137 [Paspalum notatum var. saurae]|uniref:Tf2-1-like SH3-like domain-containing protein n=1 Tax=Paspalum notatum var. saurae TaxID=547442 RepID=A0AAQ3PSC2_PASNO